MNLCPRQDTAAEEAVNLTATKEDQRQGDRRTDALDGVETARPRAESHDAAVERAKGAKDAEQTVAADEAGRKGGTTADHGEEESAVATTEGALGDAPNLKLVYVNADEDARKGAREEEEEAEMPAPNEGGRKAVVNDDRDGEVAVVIEEQKAGTVAAAAELVVTKTKKEKTKAKAMSFKDMLLINLPSNDVAVVVEESKKDKDKRPAGASNFDGRKVGTSQVKEETLSAVRKMTLPSAEEKDLLMLKEFLAVSDDDVETTVDAVFIRESKQALAESKFTAGTAASRYEIAEKVEIAQATPQDGQEQRQKTNAFEILKTLDDEGEREEEEDLSTDASTNVDAFNSIPRRDKATLLKALSANKKPKAKFSIKITNDAEQDAALEKALAKLQREVCEISATMWDP